MGAGVGLLVRSFVLLKPYVSFFELYGFSARICLRKFFLLKKLCNIKCFISVK
jgi:hypothetical protein